MIMSGFLHNFAEKISKQEITQPRCGEVPNVFIFGTLWALGFPAAPFTEERDPLSPG